MHGFVWTSPPTRSYQIAEDDEDPVLIYIPAPNLQPQDLILGRNDEFYHFVTPNKTIGFGVTCPITRSPAPQHPDTIPLAVHAFWDLCCNFERLGLGATWAAVPRVDDFLSDTLDEMMEYEVNLLRTRKASGRSWAATKKAMRFFTACCLARQAGPLRRRAPRAWLKVMDGGVEPEKETLVFPIPGEIDMVHDMLYRGSGIQVIDGPEHPGHPVDVGLMPIYPLLPYADRLRRHEVNIQALNALTNIGRFGRSTTFFPNDRNSVIRFYESKCTHSEYEIEHTAGKKYAYARVIGDAVYSSGCDVEQLTEIDLEEMRCHQRHTGRFLICRVITEVRVGLEIAFVVEDHSGRAITLSILNYDNLPVVLPRSMISDRYPVGAVFAVKEPYIGLGHTTGIAEIRVAVRIDIERLPSSPSTKWRFPSPVNQEMTVSEAKERGTAALVGAKYEKAVELLSMGLRGPTDELTPILEIALRLNRCLANSYLRRPGAALRDCLILRSKAAASKTFALTLPQRQKIAARKLQAAYELQLWNTAQDALSQCKALNVDEKQWSKYQSALTSRLTEAKGIYDWVGYVLRAFGPSMGANPMHHLAEYCGPIEVRDMGSYGRGLIVTRDVKAGDIVLVERHIHRSMYSHGAQVHLFEATKGQQDMRAGTSSPGTTVVSFIADPSRVQALAALAPHPTRLTPFLSEVERLDVIKGPLPSFNTDHVVRQEKANAFGDVVEGSKTFGGSSMMNHSCLSNAGSIEFKDCKVIWAQNDLKAGTELTVSYAEPERSHKSRSISFKRTWDFVCECQLCKDDQEEDEDDAGRERLMSEMWPKVLAKYKSLPHPPLTELLSKQQGSQIVLPCNSAPLVSRPPPFLLTFCDKLQATYSKSRKTPKLALARVYTETQDAFTSGYPRGASGPIEGYKMLLEAQGAVFASPSERRRTKLAITCFPPEAKDESTVRALLLIAMLSRIPSPTTSGDIEESNAWSRSAWAAFKAINGPLGTEMLFRGRFAGELTLLPDAKFQ